MICLWRAYWEYAWDTALAVASLNERVLSWCPRT
jgi:hypothetical protein